MDFDDLEPKKKSGFELGADFSLFFVVELETLIEDLKSEIIRVEEANGAKKAEISTAHSIFKS